jgi:hypothetical protein
MSAIPETKAVVIENPEQASSNFFWTYESGNQIFNLQTTIRGILTYPQIQGHVKSAMEAMAHVQELGGIAKQVGGGASASTAPAATIPAATPLNEIPGYTAPGEIAPATPAAPIVPHDAANQFDTELLVCEIKLDGNGEPKQFFKIKGGMYKKFGITIWPEVLIAAGIPVAKLVAQDYNLPGYRATFVLNDKGKPSKVTILEKVAS